jgi:uncharacterized cupredoxin-like copper-binding protein
VSTARLKTPAAAVAAAARLALAAAGCGEKRESGTGTGGASTATQAAGPATGTVEVTETEFKLDPASPQIPKAGTIEFKVSNEGATEHALEIETSSGEIETKPIAPGKSATLKADLKAGTYEWYCPIDGHKDKGMKGEIVVAGGGSGGSSTTPEDSGSSSGNGGY